MNRRITLVSVAERIEATLSQLLGVVRIGTALDHDYASVSGNPTYWPAVWVGAQRSTAIGDARGYTGRIRQEMRVEVVVRVVMARVVQGETNREEAMTALVEAVADTLVGWQPEHAVFPLVWVSSTDGPPGQSAISVDMLFATQTAHQYAA